MLGRMMRFLQCSLLLIAVALNSFASQPLETETARILPAGTAKVEATGEFQTSRDGTERAWPFLIEYGFNGRTELTIEPVFSTVIRSKSGPATRGPGDLEVTLTQLLRGESQSAPALAIAGEIKFPTARKALIGTGKADYSAFAIASKRLERLDVHGNLGYTIVGRPAGVRLRNIINYAIAEEYHFSPKLDIVAELVGNTSSTGDTVEGSSSGSGTLPPEAAGAENAILAGVRYYVRSSLFFSLGLSYDNNHALLIRPGVTYRVGR